MDALSEVEVDVDDLGQSGFRLTFSVDKQSPLQILFIHAPTQNLIHHRKDIHMLLFLSQLYGIAVINYEAF